MTAQTDVLSCLLSVPHQPGRKSLLLKQLFTDAQAGARNSSAPKSLHQKAALEEERQRVVAAYRHMRQQKIERSAAAAAKAR